jgi:hypothetical protein
MASNASMSPMSNQADRSMSKNRLRKIDQGHKHTTNLTNQATSRSKRIQSEDQKFSNVRLDKYESKRKKSDK